ncbi:MAG: rhomboid family intramembrane serine protease [Desulfovibrio sp.]|nr:rhomboid family intramembrane serine protease [Desulfovibrio sp.]
MSRLLASGDPRRQAAVPPSWRNVAAVLARQAPAVTEARINGWLLVCAARKIPHLIIPRGTSSPLYVPALYERIALREITAFERERPPVFSRTPTREQFGLVLCFFLLLAVWHGLRFHWFGFALLPAPPFPALPGAWGERFGLDIFRVWFSGEWWRCATALTLHTEGAHLAGNLAFGLFFFLPLCRRAGTGLGLLLAVLAGMLGNAGDVAFRDAPLISMGFSTALFGAVGGLCALAGVDALRSPSPAGGRPLSLFSPRFSRFFFSIAAGLALLGFLGGGAEAHTDYAAHIAGFCAGVILAFPLLPLDAFLRRLSPRREAAAQILLALISLLLLALAWGYALLA